MKGGGLQRVELPYELREVDQTEACRPGNRVEIVFQEQEAASGGPQTEDNMMENALEGT